MRHRNLLQHLTHRHFYLSVLIITISMMVTIQALAAPTTQEQARRVVNAWIALDSTPMDAQIGQTISEIDTITDTLNNPVYYVVHLIPKGFVIVSADDLVEPIIAFSSQGEFDPSLDNPFGALVTQDVPGRIMAARDAEEKHQRLGSGFSLDDAFQNARKKWTSLENRSASFGLDFKLPSITDVYVAPLLQSEWSQTTACSNACYNYYTPNGWPCGCVATAMAQVMRYHSFPTTGPGTPTFTISVGGVSEDRTLRGGDGSGGAYNWSDMVLIPGPPVCPTNETQREAIGALTYDCGLSVEMSYGSGGSGANTLDTRDALVDTFGYANAVKGYNSASNINSTELNKMINPNLHADLPVILGITGAGGHAIVADGYGYNSSTLYHHLNMGWAGFDDAWYNLPTINTTNYSFNSVYKSVYNIYTTGSGEIISGRVTDIAGNPISGVLVSATRTGGGTWTDTTGSDGFYVFAKIPSSSSYTITAQKTGYTFNAQSVSTGTSNNYSTCGNLWGVDFIHDIGCTFGINPSSDTIGSDGGEIDVSVTASPSACPWTVVEDLSWVSASPDSGTGNGSVTLTVSANFGPERTGSVHIAGQLFTITQSGASVSGPFRCSTTFTSDNGSSGNMFDVTNLSSQPIMLTGYFEGNFDTGESGEVQVWYRTGSYAGYETESSGWSLLGTDQMTSLGDDTPTPYDVGSTLTIAPGQTIGMFVYCGLAVNYTNGANVYDDGVIQITTGAGKGSSSATPPVSGGTYSPRTWNGTIEYVLPGGKKVIAPILPLLLQE